MLFQGQFSTKWRKGEKRENKFVFIGRNIPKERLEAEFAQTYAPAELRFAVGKQVFANVGEFKSGHVIKHWDDGNAYRVHVEGHGDVWAPIDDDEFICAKKP